MLMWDGFSGTNRNYLYKSSWYVEDANKGGNRNVQISGGETMQLVPWKVGNEWTGARVYYKMKVTPRAGKKTMFETGSDGAATQPR